MNSRPGYALAHPPAPGEVNLTNWQDSPWNAWGFSHLTELVPTAVVSRGERTGGGAVGLGDLDRSRFDGFVEATGSRAVVVLRDGVPVREWYGEDMTVDTRHTLMSISKSLCGLLYGRLIGQGVVTEETTIGSVVPDLAGSAFGDATIRQALDMQVSVDYVEAYHDPAAHVAQQDRVAGWRPRLPDDPADTYEFLTTLKRLGEHGRHLQYCSATTDSLAWVVERATGRRYHEVLSDELWSLVPTENDAVITVDPGGFAFANGGVACTARDLARFGQLVLDGGAVDGRQVVPEAWIQQLLAGGSLEAAAGSPFQEVHPNGSYLGQWWVTGDDHGVVYGAGIHGQYLWVDPTARVVVAKFAAHRDAVSLDALRANSEFMRWLVASVAG
ncbi:serine hydrolase domain-containing protein [Nocardioides sp. GCM10027113]|uniref:serine hydrolase domain-containing protein n=1 Tax=unclassified Nocardioides TaxID=2615069 RepID=UPI0036161E7F